jgi:hypothetical protein
VQERARDIMEESTPQEFTVIPSSMTSRWLSEQMDRFYAEQLEQNSGSTGEILEILSDANLAA